MPPIDVPSAEQAAIDRVVDGIARAGASLDAEQRVRLAGWSRSVAAGDDVRAGDPLAEIARTVTAEPASIRPRWIETLGTDVASYVEALAVVARLRAVDTFCAALGQPLAPLPAPRAGAATGERAADAAVDGGWVPTVGRASALTAVSAVPAEHDAVFDLHGAFYLSPTEMGDLDADRGLHRTQMELVAARTSALNDCFYWLLAHTAMLRASADHTDRPIDLAAVARGGVDPLLAGGAELVAFTDAAVLDDVDELPVARAALLDRLGPDAVVRAAACAGVFQMMNRLLDGVGAPIARSGLPLAADLGLTLPPHLTTI